MKLTNRGYAVLVVIVASVAMAGLYGPRSLNAVVAPAVVALVAAVVIVRRLEQPTVERIPPADGFEGTRRTVRLSITSKSTFTGHVIDAVDDGIAADGNERTTSIDDETLTYDVVYQRRGDHELGPTTIVARDVLGLVERTFRYHNEDTVLVYPRVYDLTGHARHAMNMIPEYGLVNMRGEFDSLREYERGDALRDIHWKSSARLDNNDLFVKEYVDEDDVGSIDIVAESTGDGNPTDRMAEAAASIATFLLAAGLTVSLSAPEGLVDPGEGTVQRQYVLELLARTGSGGVPPSEREDADILVVGHDDGTVIVHVEGREVTFDALAGGRATAETERDEQPTPFAAADGASDTNVATTNE